MRDTYWKKKRESKPDETIANAQELQSIQHPGTQPASYGTMQRAETITTSTARSTILNPKKWVPAVKKVFNHSSAPNPSQKTMAPATSYQQRSTTGHPTKDFSPLNIASFRKNNQ